MIPKLDTKDYDRDVNLLIRMAKASGRPVTYSLAQWSGDPKGWRKTLDIMVGRSQGLAQDTGYHGGEQCQGRHRPHRSGFPSAHGCDWRTEHVCKPVQPVPKL